MPNLPTGTTLRQLIELLAQAEHHHPELLDMPVFVIANETDGVQDILGGLTVSSPPAADRDPAGGDMFIAINLQSV